MSYEKDLQKFARQAEKAIDELISSKTLTPIAQKAAEIIKRRTRLGQGVAASGEKKKALAPLADSTKLSRKKKQKRGELSDLTTPNRSNLTETGEMLESLEGRAINKLIEVSVKGDRNKKLAAFHTLGRSSPTFMPKRPFLNLAMEDIKQLTAVLQDEFTNILNKVFKK
ncbi:hypothetical protein EKK58_08595 [Candidatus Dependentiae bacterium]|nr:MAG: hypothetical protein EKK58_08595 [Candidatus Dependentiae bacterium]